MIIFLFICLAVGITYFLDAGVVWIICQLLPAIGLTMIGNWHVEFSWTLVWIVLLLQVLFTSATHKNK